MGFFDTMELKTGKMALYVTIAVSIGGMVEILPLFFMKGSIPPVAGVKPYSPLRLEGRDIYVREGCYLCHSQQIRPFRAETERYGHYSLAGESVYDHPFQWGSERQGPDLSREGGKYPDSWQFQHLSHPRSIVPESIMPSYAWMRNRPLYYGDIQTKMRVLRFLGTPYTDAQIAAAPAELKGKTEMQALVAYLQGLGTDIKR